MNELKIFMFFLVSMLTLSFISASTIVDLTGSYQAENYPQTCYRDWMGSLDGKLVSTTDVSNGWLTRSDCNCYTITEEGYKLGCWQAATSSNNGFRFYKNVQVTNGEEIKIDFGYFAVEARKYIYQTSRSVLFKNGTDWDYCSETINVPPREECGVSGCTNLAGYNIPPIVKNSEPIRFSISGDGKTWQTCQEFSFDFTLPNGQCYHGDLYENDVSCVADFDSDRLYVKVQEISGSYNDMWDYIKVSASDPLEETNNTPECQGYSVQSDCAGLAHDECEGTYIWSCVDNQCVTNCDQPPIECNNAGDCLDKEHPDYEGKWTCTPQATCVWKATSNPDVQNTTGPDYTPETTPANDTFLKKLWLSILTFVKGLLYSIGLR